MLGRNARFQAWLDKETAKYQEAIVMVADSDQLRVVQGRLRQLREIKQLCDTASKT